MSIMVDDRSDELLAETVYVPCSCEAVIPLSEKHFVLSVEEGQASVSCAICGSELSDDNVEYEMRPVPVTVRYEKSCTSSHYWSFGLCDCGGYFVIEVPR